MRPAMDAISLANAAAVLGAVEATAGAAATGRLPLAVARFFAGRFLTGLFLAAARLRAADVVCFFLLVWDGDSNGPTAIATSAKTAKTLSLRYSIDSSWEYSALADLH